MAGRTEETDWEAAARRLIGGGEVVSVLDPARGTARVACYESGVLVGALFVARSPVAVMRDYLVTLPGTTAPNMLSGRTPADVADPGPVLCSCFGIGINTIVTAVETEGLMSVDAIGDALGAGTNCGSCRPELATVLAGLQIREAAQ